MRRHLAPLAVLLAATSAAAGGGQEPVAALVKQIQRADYAGDRAGLKRFNSELEPFAGDGRVGVRVRYWRGFALWRRAFNGFNDQVSPAELEADLTQALAEFDGILAADPGFIDAKVGAISCLSTLMYLNRSNPERVKQILPRVRALSDEALAAAPDHPRLSWVIGVNRWYLPPERGGGHDKAVETYLRGLEAARKQKPSRDPLEPSWGEPELLMNLAWSSLHADKPDVAAAERYARSALRLVPYWHYVRDILLPQILAAK